MKRTRSALSIILICLFGACADVGTYEPGIDYYLDELTADSVIIKLKNITYGSNLYGHSQHMVLPDSTFVAYSHNVWGHILIGRLENNENRRDTAEIVAEIEMYEKTIESHSIRTVETRPYYQSISFDLSRVYNRQINPSDSVGVLVWCKVDQDSVLSLSHIQFYKPRVIEDGVLYYTYK